MIPVYYKKEGDVLTVSDSDLSGISASTANCNIFDINNPDFTFLISDQDFINKDVATAQQIQAFFEKEGGAVKNPIDGILLSEAVYGIAQKQKLNSIMLLATLQKEQSLITQKTLTQKQKDYAAGCGCPDTGNCNPVYKGLDKQMECMANILNKWYNDGKTKTFPFDFKGLNYNNAKCKNGQPTELSLKNAATYSLYKYTPHTYDYCLSTKGGGNFAFLKLYNSYYQDILGKLPGCETIPSESKPNLIKVPVLIYHQISSGTPGETVVSEQKFSEQMKYLYDNKYNTISIDELVSFMKNGALIPDKSIVLTFDDGWNGVKNAIPILNKYNFKASFAIIAKSGIGGSYLTWDDINSIAQNPKFEILSHTMTHPWSKTSNLVTWIDGKTQGKGESDVDYELKESKKLIEKNIGKQVKYLVWPVGWYNDALIAKAKDAGYEAALTVEDGVNIKSDDIFKIKRIFIDGACDIQEFKATLTDYKYHICQKRTPPTLGNSP